MAVEKPRGPHWLTELAARLAANRAVVAAAGLVFLVFAILGPLTLLQSVLGFALIAGVALLTARTGANAGPAYAEGEYAGEPLRDSTVRHFADTLQDPCLVLDRRAIVLHRNPAAARQFPNATPGNPLAFSLRHPNLLGAIETARRTATAQTVELHQTVPNETWHKVVVSPLDPAGNWGAGAGYLVLTMQSLTEEKRIDAMRADFIANASHELRTPLTSLVGFIDTLLGPAAKDAAARERFLGIMRTQAARMSKLIDDLLSLSRIEMRQHVRPTGSVELNALLREVGEGLQTQAQEAGLEVKLDVPDEPAIVTGDHDELYEVFENLLDNAIKYGADGGRVDIALTPVTEPQGYDFAVTVTDYGAGIEAAHVPRLTERFYRVDAESSRKKKGTGLGLAIVKHIVSRHRGTLSIRSTPGRGTRVDVLLPR